MILQVKRYNSDLKYHECTDEQGVMHRVDLFVHSDLPKEVTHENIVGKTVEVDELYPYETIGIGVKII